MTNLCSFNRFILICLALLFSSVAHASYLYSYTSDNFSEFLDTQSIAGASGAGCFINCNFNSGDRITGSFSLANQLASNLLLADISPDLYAFNAGAVSVSSLDADALPLGSSTRFQISTNAAGDITDWFFSIQSGVDLNNAVVGDQRRAVVSSPFGDRGEITLCVGLNLSGDCGVITTEWGATAFVDRVPGNWAVEEIPAIPIPAAVWLFGTALIGLVGFGRLRKSAQ
jgi:hypothetical protein